MKTLPTLACLIAGSRLLAQSALAPTATALPPEGTAPSSMHQPVPHHGQASRASTTVLGEAGNVYTILISAQNQVSYDPDINAITFVHRQNPAGFSDQGGNGTLRFDVSMDGGANWTLDRLLTPGLFDGSADTIIGVRYPSGTIYNPPGNTDPNNAYIVSTGMALNALDTSQDYVNTGHLQRSSARLDGTQSTNDFTDWYGDRTTHAAYGLCTKSDGTLWAISSRQSNSTLNADTLSYKDHRINKGIWNTGTQRVDWTSAATLTPAISVYDDPSGDGSKDTQMNTWNLGFSPDGQTGYAVILAKEDDGIPCGPMPLVWKSTDGGDNWMQLPNHAWGEELWMMENIYPANDNGEIRPYFSDIDLTVDANGRLHMIASMYSQYYGSSPDSVNYIFTALESRSIIHVSTIDGVSWTIRELSDKYNDDFEYPVQIVAPPGPFQTDRPQASRTADGTHVFFTWNRSADTEAENLFPEIHGAGYNAGTDRWTEARSLSAGTDADALAWWHTVSPVCISDGDDYDYELPTVFAEPGNFADVASGFVYLKGIGFNEDEFVVGMNEPASSGSFTVYPNPNDGHFMLSTIGMGAVRIMINDATGRVVRELSTRAVQTLIDLGTDVPGVYNVNVINDEGHRLTQRIIVR